MFSGIGDRLNDETMEKPILKNHVVIEVITTFEQFVTVIHTESTVYVRPWHKVHPGSFFNKSAIYPPDRIRNMIANGDFWRVVKKTENQTLRIRERIMEIKRIIESPALHPEATIADVYLAIDI